MYTFYLSLDNNARTTPQNTHFEQICFLLKFITVFSYIFVSSWQQVIPSDFIIEALNDLQKENKVSSQVLQSTHAFTEIKKRFDEVSQGYSNIYKIEGENCFVILLQKLL